MTDVESKQSKLTDQERRRPKFPTKLFQKCNKTPKSRSPFRCFGLNSFPTLSLNPAFVQDFNISEAKPDIYALKSHQWTGNVRPSWRRISCRYLVVDNMLTKIPRALTAQRLQASSCSGCSQSKIYRSYRYRREMSRNILQSAEKVRGKAWPQGHGGRKHTWYLLSSRKGTPRYRSENADAVGTRRDELVTQIHKRSRKQSSPARAAPTRLELQTGSLGVASPAGLTVELPVRHWGHRTGTLEDAVGGLEHHQGQVCPITLKAHKEP